MDISENTKQSLYSGNLKYLDAINDHRVSKVDIEQYGINLMICKESVTMNHPLQKRLMIKFDK